MIYLGIDPGKGGAIAVIGGGFASSGIEIYPTPVIKATKGKGRTEYNLVRIREILEMTEPDFVTLERSQPLPPKMGGSIANYHRGVSRGWEWMLVALEIPYQLVAARTWQKMMHAGTPGGDTKQRSILAAQRLFPKVNLKRTERCRVADHNFAEALLLAEFGRRTHQGTRTEVELEAV